MGFEVKRSTISPPDGEGYPVTLIRREGSGSAFVVRHGAHTILETDDGDAAKAVVEAIAGRKSKK